MKFKKKPVVIEAWQFNGKDGRDWPTWMHDYESEQGGRIYLDTNREVPSLYIPTLEGTMVASVGDWIIKGMKGEVYPCKPDIFQATYERFDD